MKKSELLDLVKNLPMDGEINFYLLPKDKGLREESDENDEPIESIEIIYSGGLDSDEPYIDLGIISAETRSENDIENSISNFLNRETYNQDKLNIEIDVKTGIFIYDKDGGVMRELELIDTKDRELSIREIISKLKKII